MNLVFSAVLSMSVSGALLISVFLLAKRFLKDKISRQWQYYIWLIVILRLLLPFGPETSLMGNLHQEARQAIIQADSLPQPPSRLATPENAFADSDRERNGGTALDRTEAAYRQEAGMESQQGEAAGRAGLSAGSRLVRDATLLLMRYCWMLWLVAALGRLLWKITAYQGFLRYVDAGSVPVSDIGMLDQLSITAKRAGIKRPVELCINPLVSSPLLIGYRHPRIVLPDADIPREEFRYIALHELTHCRRQDMLYKWLVQVTVCVHWFNPLVHCMSREITKACEFSCDEALLAGAGKESAQEYGKTLLNAMASVGKCREHPGAVTLSENKQLLKERLGAIMSFKKPSRASRLLTGILTLGVICGASFIGVYPVAAADATHSADQENILPLQSGDSQRMQTLTLKGTTYYLVYSEEQLRAIGTGEYGMDQNYMQQADIELSADEWVPIGTWDTPFTGTFNGNGFEITGLTMTDPDAKIIGLFGVAENAHIYNVTMREYDIASAGRNALGKSVGAVLAIGRGCRSYDNFIYEKEAGQRDEDGFSQIERYYGEGSLPLFQIAFSRLDAKAQEQWLDRIYADQRIAFWGAVVSRLDGDCALVQRYAEKAYQDSNVAFFSVLAMQMREEALELWLDRTLEDENWRLQSVLFNAIDKDDWDDWDDEFDNLKETQEQKWVEAQLSEYRAVGVVVDGKRYYYQGQLVDIFLDIRPNKSFYTLDMNPAGTVNIKILRGEDGTITGVSYMTDAEVAELFGDEND